MQVANPSPAAVYTGISNAMITITRLEGFRTLWRGVSSVVMGAGGLQHVALSRQRTANEVQDPHTLCISQHTRP